MKGRSLDLAALLNEEELAKKYEGGSLVIARLCPSDYHRFHFPFICTPKTPHLIPGPLFSVNPLALQQNFEILTTNKRMVTELHNPLFQDVAYVEVGATSVGSIHQTFTPHSVQPKGGEKRVFFLWRIMHPLIISSWDHSI